MENSILGDLGFIEGYLGVILCFLKALNARPFVDDVGFSLKAELILIRGRIPV